MSSYDRLQIKRREKCQLRSRTSSRAQETRTCKTARFGTHDGTSFISKFQPTRGKGGEKGREEGWRVGREFDWVTVLGFPPISGHRVVRINITEQPTHPFCLLSVETSAGDHGSPPYHRSSCRYHQGAATIGDSRRREPAHVRGYDLRQQLRRPLPPRLLRRWRTGALRQWPPCATADGPSQEVAQAQIYIIHIQYVYGSAGLCNSSLRGQELSIKGVASNFVKLFDISA